MSYLYKKTFYHQTLNSTNFTNVQQNQKFFHRECWFIFHLFVLCIIIIAYRRNIRILLTLHSFTHLYRSLYMVAHRLPGINNIRQFFYTEGARGMSCISRRNDRARAMKTEWKTFIDAKSTRRRFTTNTFSLRVMF